MPVAGADRTLFTNRVSLRTHSWLADHRVHGVCVVPSAALVELAVRAGDEVGATLLDEFTVTAPLAVPDDRAVQLQVAVGAADAAGRRTVTMHSRADDGDAPWTEHARGLLSATASGVPFDLCAWPPAGAEEVMPEEADAVLHGTGVSYGPVFRAVTASWRRDGELFAEIRLEEEQTDAGFSLHPALLDAAVRPVLSATSAGGAACSADEWRGVRLFATGASVLRVRIAVGEDGAAAVQLADAGGGPVAEVRSVSARPVPDRAVSATAHRLHDALFHMDWTPLLLPDPVDADEVPCAVLGEASAGAERFATVEEAGAAAAAGRSPRFVVYRPETEPGLSPAVATHRRTEEVLRLVRGWLADDRLEKTPLLVLTSGAVATTEGGAPMGFVKLVGRAGVRRRCRRGASRRARRLVVSRGRGGLGCGAFPG